MFFSQSLSLFSTTVCLVFVWIAIFTLLHPIQSGSQLSVNQEAVEPSLVAGSPAVRAVTTPFINTNIGSVDSLSPSSYSTSSGTGLPLELHIDEDGCSAPTCSAGSTVVIGSSKSLQYSQVQEIDDGGCVTSEISHVESLSISNTIKPSSRTEVNSPTHMSVAKVSAGKVSSPLGRSLTPVTVGRSSSPVPTARSFSPVIVSKSPSPVTVSINPSPILRAKSPSPPDLKCSNLSQSYKSPSPVPKSYSPVPRSQSPVTVPRLTSPVPKSASPMAVPSISSLVTIPKSASPETVPKSASPVSNPRLSSPVPKISSPVTVPNISSSATIPKSSSPDTLQRNAGPVTLPRLSSPVTVPKSETAVPRSPALITRKSYTVPGTSSPRASPVQLAAVPSNSLSPSEKQGAEILDVTWPCREPLLDDALDKLLTPDSTQLSDNQPPASIMPGDEDRSWEDEDGIYPDLSREGTLTPMTESSWMDECFTPSTCPGTPDVTLDLPTQQPSAVERLSASGQVGRRINSPKISCWHKAREASGAYVVFLLFGRVDRDINYL